MVWRPQRMYMMSYIYKPQLPCDRIATWLGRENLAIITYCDTGVYHDRHFHSCNSECEDVVFSKFSESAVRPSLYVLEIAENADRKCWEHQECGQAPSPPRVSSKQTKINFGSNQNKLKQDLFCVCFGLFRETKNKIFWFVSVFRTYIETTETNRSVS